MKFFKVFARKKSVQTLVLHIGSGKISGALVEIPPNEKPLVISTHFESLILKKDKGFNAEIVSLKSSLARCFDKISVSLSTLKSSHRGMNAICVVSSPWFVSQTKIVSIESKQGTKITKSFLDSVVKKESDIFLAELKLNKKTDTPDELTRFEAEIILVKLNGYSVINPLDKIATHVEISILLSFMPKSVMDTLTQTIQSFHKIQNISFSTSSFITFNVVRKLFPDIHDFVLTEIGGEVTDVSIVKHDSLLETITLPLGGYTLVRRVSESLNILPDIALSYLSMEKNETAHAQLESKIALAKKSLGKEWITSFKSAFTLLSQELFVPRDVFIMTEQWTGDFFLELIKTSDSKELAFSSGTIEPHVLTVHTLSDILSYKDKSEKDTFISLIAIFISVNSVRIP